MEPNQELLKYIETEKARGVNREALLAELVKAGWKNEDIQNGLARVYGGTAPTNEIGRSKRWWAGKSRFRLFTIAIGSLFALSTLGSMGEFFGLLRRSSEVREEMFFLWFVAAGGGILVVLGYCLVGVTHVLTGTEKGMEYFAKGAGLLLVFAIVGFGTCLVNLSGLEL